jgi:hypothetical protein
MFMLGFPFVPQDAHVDKVDVFAVAPDVLAQATFFAEATSPVGMDGAFIVAINRQPDLAHVAQAKGVVQQHAHGVSSVAFSPVFSIADADTHLTALRYYIEMEQSAIAYILAIGLYRKVRTVASALLHLLVEFGFQPGKRLRLPGVSPPSISNSTSLLKAHCRCKSSRFSARSTTFSPLSMINPSSMCIC